LEGRWAWWREAKVPIKEMNRVDKNVQGKLEQFEDSFCKPRGWDRKLLFWAYSSSVSEAKEGSHFRLQNDSDLHFHFCVFMFSVLPLRSIFPKPENEARDFLSDISAFILLKI
jgi:hypothetical protein